MAYRIVEIERNVGGSFGFSVIGGVDTDLPPMVCALVHNGSAQLSGKIHVGDVLVEVNDECVSRLPIKQVVETIKSSSDTLKLRLRKDPAAVARARPYLRRYSVQDPKLRQFKSKFRRSASLPSRAKKPLLRSRCDTQPLHIPPRDTKRSTAAPSPTESSRDMSKGKARLVGQETSPTGIERGTDGTFRFRMSARSGSFSKITTSFPAHGGPPHTIENAERTNARHAVCAQDLNREPTRDVRRDSTQEDTKSIPQDFVRNPTRDFARNAMRDLTRTISETNFSTSSKGPLHSSSLPEIALARVREIDTGAEQIWHRSSGALDEFRRRGSLKPAVERTTQSAGSQSSVATSRKDYSYGSLPSSSKSVENTMTVNMDASPYPFRRPFNNSFGAVHSKSQNHKGDSSREKEADENSGLSCDELARRLFHLEGFGRNEVAPMLSKNDDFTKKVAELFMKYFDFHGKDLIESLRMMLNKFNLTGETQERERILIPFSNRYHECNKPDYGSADAVHTLVCAVMLLNTDLHGEQTLGRRMKQTEFMKNLSGLCDGKDFPINVLKSTYASVKADPLEFHSEDIESNHANENIKANGKNTKDSNGLESVGSLALMGYQASDDDGVIYKEGLVYRKLVEEAGGKKASAWKRGWQPFFATLRGMILYLHKPDESHDFEDTRFSLGVHHAFASPAFDYRKRPAVFRFITADWKVLLFQARDKEDMLGWVEGLNLVAASFSSPPLPAPVGSCKTFQRPVLPFSRTRLTLTQQLASHEAKAQEMANVLIDHLNKQPHGIDHRHREMVDWLEKRDFYDYEYKRYRSYSNILKSSKLQTQVRERGKKQPRLEAVKRNGLLSEHLKRYSSLNDLLNAADDDQKAYANYRESYFMAIYKG